MKKLIKSTAKNTNAAKFGHRSEIEKRSMRTVFAVGLAVALCAVMALPALAADPIASINKLSDFVFAAIKAVGLIILGLGIVQLGLSLKSHDASQRANGIITILGGVIIAFAKDILDLIMA